MIITLPHRFTPEPLSIQPEFATSAHAHIDTFTRSTVSVTSAASLESSEPKSYVSRWDIPGILTFSWIDSTVASLRAKGDYSGPLSNAIGGLMILASPVVIPFSLAADIVNTVIFPGKVIYRAFS